MKNRLKQPLLPFLLRKELVISEKFATFAI